MTALSVKHLHSLTLAQAAQLPLPELAESLRFTMSFGGFDLIEGERDYGGDTVRVPRALQALRHAWPFQGGGWQQALAVCTQDYAAISIASLAGELGALRSEVGGFTLADGADPHAEGMVLFIGVRLAGGQLLRYAEVFSGYPTPEQEALAVAGAVRQAGQVA